MKTAQLNKSHKVQNVEKPQNGFKGLKHWQHDLAAGLVVSLVSVPLSIGIAIASGAAPICGLTSAIIAGFILPFLGGSYVTISGPAAGLAPAIYAGMLSLGKGNLSVGYPLVLVAIFFTGIVQVILYKFRAAKFSAIFPSTVIKGMLTAIGIMIITKQIPLFIGHPFVAHEFWGIILETPHELALMSHKVFGIGVFTLALIFILASVAKRHKWLQIIPPPIVAVAVGSILGQIVKLDRKFLIHLPDNPLAHGITMPGFNTIFHDHSLWYSLIITIVTLTLIDGVESLATITAIDKIDPFKRKSEPNRTLFAMGASNICSSMIGGLTIIPGGVKSTTCILGGGRTQWANFYNACFLLIYLFFFRQSINLIPLTVLSAVLIYTGYKLSSPKLWKDVASVGIEQFIIFVITILVTLTTDLLWGIFAGILLKLVLNTWFINSLENKKASLNSHKAPSLNEIVKSQFQNPVTKSGIENGIYNIYFNKPLVCFNTIHVNEALSKIPKDIKGAYLHLLPGVTLIDHTTCDNLLNFVEQNNMEGNSLIKIIGLECMKKRSLVNNSMHHIAFEQQQSIDFTS